jgi:hypothetical protein
MPGIRELRRTVILVELFSAFFLSLFLQILEY